jgi:hypothetical protein
MDVLPSRSYDAMKKQATSGNRKNRKRPGNLREQIDPLMCQAYVDASKEANAGAWPTPRALEIDETEESWKARMDKRVSEGKEGFVSQNLCMTTKSWSTPVSRDSGSHTITENHPDGFNKNLVNDAIRWPTPTTTMVKGHYSEKAQIRKDGKSRTMDRLDNAVVYVGPSSKKWMTPGANEDAAGTIHGNMQKMLTHQSKEFAQWPTPVHSEIRQGNQHRNNKDAKGTQQSLTTIAMKEELWDTNTGHQDQMNLTSGEESSQKDPTLPPRWQTPVTLDQVAGRDIANQEKIRRTLTNADLSRKMMGAKKRLNVTFVEWLMGHPIGWSSVTPIEMSVYKVWVMESFRLLGRLR